MKVYDKETKLAKMLAFVILFQVQMMTVYICRLRRRKTGSTYRCNQLCDL